MVYLSQTWAAKFLPEWGWRLLEQGVGHARCCRVSRGQAGLGTYQVPLA